MKTLLFNPGPTNVHDDVRAALITKDMSHREKEFKEVLLRVNQNLVRLLNGEGSHNAILFVASGTGANEAVISTIHGKLLVLNNGRYSERLCQIAERYQIPIVQLTMPPLKIMDIALIEQKLQMDTKITHIALVHHETTTGMLAPLRDIGMLAKKYNKKLLVDGISSIGCQSFDLKKDNITFCTLNANKCLESIPGVSFVIGRTDEIELLKGKSRSFYFDIFTQWQKEREGKIPYTAAIQLVFALDVALQRLLEEGYDNRVARYKKLAQYLRDGLKKMGFDLILFPGEAQSNVVTSVRLPLGLDFYSMRDKMLDRGMTIYSAQNALEQGYFFIATMGNITEQDVQKFLQNLQEVLIELNFSIKCGTFDNLS